MKPYGPVVLLAISAFWACIAGGYVSIEGLGPADNLLLSVLKGDTYPLLTHALIFLPIAVAFIWVLRERKIQQVPTNRVSVPLAVMFALIVGTAPLTLFKAATLCQVAEWLSYGVAFLAVVSAGGRRQGPLAILTAIFLGCTFTAVLGLREYGVLHNQDPTHRIFSTWIGPNALAAMLDVGFVIGLGVVATQERIYALLAGLATVFIGFAIVLTQSKGGVAALAVGVVAYAFATAVWTRRDSLVILARSGFVLVGVALLVGALTLSQRHQVETKGSLAGQPTAVSRFSQASDTQEQSFGFRKLLWITSLDLIEENPVGRGAGTFRFWSSRPGLVTQTQLGHNSYLQLGVESGAMAPAILILALLAWVYYLFRGGQGVPLESRRLRAGVFGAVVAIAVHSAVDSDLHYYGIGLVFFMLLGVGLLLSTDAVAPEFTPISLRATGIGIDVAICLVMLYCGWADRLRTDAVSLMDQNIDEARQALASLRSIMPFDADAWYLSALVASSPSDRKSAFDNAVANGPSTKYIRALASQQARDGQLDQARSTYERALIYDPNNLLALYQILEIDRNRGDEASAIRDAEQIVSVEKSPYFTIRSIPELVPLETARARVYLAGVKGDKTSLLEGALKLYRQYAAQTVPQVLSGAKEGVNYGGQSPDSARQAMREGQDVCRDLAAVYRREGRSADASRVEADAEGFGEALASLK